MAQVEQETGCTPEMARKIVDLLDLNPVLVPRGQVPKRVCEHCGKPARPPQRFCSEVCWETARSRPPSTAPARPMARAERSCPGLIAFVRDSRTLSVAAIRAAVLSRFGITISPASIYQIWNAHPQQLALEGAR